MSSDQKPLLILLWNSNGLAQHRNELEILLHDRRIDVALITETHFTDNTYFHIKDYTLYKTNFPGKIARGGTAVLVRNAISHFPLPSTSSRYLQETSITISFFSTPITVSSCYCPPNKQITQTQFLSYLRSLGPRFISGGDFNAKHPQWGCRVSNPRGHTLLSTLSSTPFQVIPPSQPTYWPTSPSKLPDILDYFITSHINLSQCFIENIYDLSSDHSPILLSFSESPILKDPIPSLIRGKIDWEAFQLYLNTHINLNIRLKTPHDVDEAVQLLTTTIQKAAWNSTDRNTLQEHRREAAIPFSLRKLIVQKRKARRKWQLSRHTRDKRTLNSLTNKLTAALRNYRQKQYDTKISQLTTSDKSLWAYTKQILNYKQQNYPLRTPSGNWAKSDEEKANLFAEHLADVFKSSDSQNTKQALYENQLQQPLQLSPPPKAINPSDVTFTIQRLKKRKAPGYDLITAEILSHLPKKAILFITHIYNSILRTTYFPVLWKYSIIKMILKPQKPPNLPTSYRPISLLPLLSKVFEKILLRRLLNSTDIEKLIPHHQFGFRAEHSTIQQCHRLIDSISSSLELGQYCTGAFLDVAQAFDRVWHLALLSKLKSVLPFTYYLVIRSFLSERFSRVSCGTSLSPIFPVLAGVPQGSILGPLLYSVFTSDIPSHPKTNLSTFADDTAILSRHSKPHMASRNLQQHLNSISQWCQENDIKVNVEKCHQVTFTLRRTPCPPVYLNGQPLPTADYVRYLGLYIDRRLTWNPHTRLKRLDIRRRFSLLYRLIGRKSCLSLNNKLTIYKSILRPMWTYGLELWSSTKPSNLKRIQSLQSRILRTIVNAPFYVSNLTIHTDLKIPFVQDLSISRYQSFHAKFASHPNPLVQAMSSMTLPDNPPRRLKRQWPRDHLNHI